MRAIRIGEAETLQWAIAALNSIEMVTVPTVVLKSPAARR